MAVAWEVGAWANDTWLGMNAGPPNAWRGATTPTSAVLSGTIIGAGEADIRAGGRTIILTLSDDIWVAVGAAFDAERQNILDGIATTHGILLDNQPVTTVVRTSDTIVTITLVADATYDITTSDVGTATIPSSALDTSVVPVVATPTFTISAIAPPVSGQPRGGDPRFWRYGHKRFPKPKYWWQRRPDVIPENIPLVGGLEDLREEEEALRALLREEPDIEVDTLRILNAYALILREQMEVLEAGSRLIEETQAEQEEVKAAAVRRKKKIMLLLH